MVGKLSLAVIPFENPIIMGVVAGSILLALVFAVLVIILFVGRTLWIMYRLHYRMMV
jgi:hypothetical protein